ncbi:MAG: FAD-dependent monooxygenase [Gammaproteobacteria bacterium]
MSARAPRGEIAVVGGGVVGMVSALLLADAGFDVSLVDPVTQLPARDAPWDLRTFALTPATRRILIRCGVWSALDAARVSTFEAIEVYDGLGDGTVRFDRTAGVSPPLAFLVELSNLITACHRALAQRARVRDFAGQVIAVVPGDDHCTLRLADGRELRTGAVLACDGADSPLRTLCGIAVDETDYAQHAVVANVTCALPHAGVARQRFLPTGPLALLPLPPPCDVAVVWSTTPEEAAWAVGCRDDEFRARLAEAFGQRAGAVTVTSRRLAFPLRRRHARSYVADRVALLGDAAHVMHPLAGQGLNVGLLDAATLAEVLGARGPAVLRAPQSALARYARIRRGENLLMLTVTEQLNRLFAETRTPIVRARNLGLRLTQHLRPLKARLIAHAMGDRGDLPALARGDLSTEQVTP